MAILADHQYNLRQYLAVSNSAHIPDLSEAVISKINNLAQLVGAPSYKKTPVFKNRHNARRRRDSNRNTTITAADWEAMRNFKTTILDKPKEGIDTEIESIRSAGSYIAHQQFLDEPILEENKSNGDIDSIDIEDYVGKIVSVTSDDINQLNEVKL